MLKNYFVIALRLLSRSKTFSIINISGLSLGIACCLILALYIQDELIYDKHHNRGDDVYRIITKFDEPRHGFDKISTVSPAIAPAIKAEIPEVEASARLFPQAMSLFKYDDKIFYESDGYIADSAIFDVLTYNFVEGNPKNSLAHSNTVVITEAISQKLFGKNGALNKVISISQDGVATDFKITGVVSNNSKSHLKANYFISIASQGPAEFFRSDEVSGEWAGRQFLTSYVKLATGHNAQQLTKKINDLLIKHGSEDMKALGFKKTLALEPIEDIYLKSDVQQSARISYVYVIASIAAFILLLACINFTNLSTARATKRAAEFGVRKVMGAFRSALVGQILGEALVSVLISILLSVVLAQLALPFFNELTAKNISFNAANLKYVIGALALLAVFTALIAGGYPAFYFSAFQPAKVLKNKYSVNNSSGWLRKSLVVFQFVIAIVLVCGVVIISRQLEYLQKKNLGFNSKAKILLPLRTIAAKTSYNSLRSELTHIGTIGEVSGAEYVPGTNIIRDMPFYAAGGSMEQSVAHKRNIVDYNFQQMLDIKLLAGRPFTDNHDMESQNKVILNRASAEALGFNVSAAVGQKIYSEWQGKKQAYEIIGVMENFHQTSLRDEILPTLFEMTKEPNYSFMIASVDAVNFDETISGIENKWKKIVSDTPFEYSFLDESIRLQYDSDRKLSRIIIVFTIIAMCISCLGLYGLSSYMAERRTKEIGIRKVMGANARQIVSMMSKEFVKLVFIAMLISIPLAWYSMDQWLQSFAYKTSIDVIVFLYAGTAALLIAMLTVSFESLKAANANPVSSLKNE